MSSADPTTHERVRRIVADDLRPVRPLLPPFRRVFFVLPLAALVALFAASRYGRRADFDALGPILTWGFSGLQWTLGLLILGLALRLAIPGYGVSRRALWQVSAATLGAILIITGITYAAHPTFVPPARAWSISYLCFVGPLEFGAPLLVVSSILAARAFPTRPATAGALCGLAAGVVTDSGWRLTCWITAPGHVLGTHALAVAALALCGAATATAIDRTRNHRKRSAGCG